MARISQRAPAHHEEDEGYFVSMSDMLTGLLFVFIILLLYFAFQFRELTGANPARELLLKELMSRLNSDGLRVEIDPVTGVLRLPDDVLFETKSDRLSARGVEVMPKLAKALADVLPCYTEEHPRLKCRMAAKSRYRIDALFIEGHTDKQRLMRDGRDTNIDLSTRRAINTYLALIDKDKGQPDLDELQTQYRGVGSKSDRPVPILSISGYGPKRPIPGYETDSETDLRKNRRIDLRFLMATPDPESARNMLLQ